MREPLFQDLHHSGRRATLRFTHEQVEMLRHDHITEYYKPVTKTCLFEDFQKRGRGVPARSTTVCDDNNCR